MQCSFPLPVCSLTSPRGQGNITLTAYCHPDPNLFSHVVLIESLGPIGVPVGNHTDHLRDYVKRQRQIHTAGSSRKPLYATMEEAAVIRATKGIVPLTIEASKQLADRGLEEVETPKGKMFTWRSDVKLTLRPPFRWNEDAVLAYFDAFTWVRNSLETTTGRI
jgi:hypothetical protein